MSATAAAALGHGIVLPPQSLAVSLQSVGEATGVSVAFSPAVVAGKRAPALNGNYEIRDALQHLIKGSGLRVEETPGGAYVIKKVEPVSASNYCAVFRNTSYRTESEDVAQPQPLPSSQPQPAASLYEEDIIVTARRRAENIQDVPIAITAIGGAQLEATNTVSLTEVQQQVPSISITAINPNNTNINIRGLGANSFLSNIGLESGVGVYVDGIYLARPAQSTFDLVDLERVEVLRGPQGTLFGKNTTAGVINIITKNPEFSPDANIDASYGNNSYYQIRGSITGPITNSVAVRLSLSQSDRDGFVRNIRTGKRMNALRSRTARAQILFEPSDSFNLRLIGDYSDQKGDCCVNVLSSLVTTRVDGSPLPNGYFLRTGRIGYQSLPFRPFARETDVDAPYVVDQKQYGFSGEINVTIGEHQLTSITAWRKWKYAPLTDADAIGLSVFEAAAQNIDDRQFTQELRFASTGKQTIDYVVGLYYYLHDADVARVTQYGRDAPDFALGAANPVTVAALDGFAAHANSDLRAKSWAAFGQATWNISDTLNLTGGLRYNHETKNGALDQFQEGGADLSLLPSVVALPAQSIRDAFGAARAFTARTTEKGLTGQASLAWHFSPDAMGYATYAHGLKAGGINLTILPPGIDPVIRPEKVNHFEAGIKGSLFRHALVLNAALFRTQVNDYQTTILDPDISASYLKNAGKVRVQGFEIESWLYPVRNLSLRAAVTYVDGKLLSFKDAPCPIEYFGLRKTCDLSGTQLPGAPKWSLSFGGDYTADLTDTLQAYAGMDFSYRSSVFTSSNAARSTLVPRYELLNARLGIKSGNGHWDATLWARNLFNKNYFQSLTVTAFNTGAVAGLVGDPRTYGLTLRFHY